MDVYHGQRLFTSLLVNITVWLSIPSALANDHPFAVDYQIVHFILGPLPRASSYFAIRSQKELEEWWSRPDSAVMQAPDVPTGNPEHPFAPPKRPMPEIDFDRYTRLVANAGVKPSGGFEVTFTSLTDLSTLGVGVLETTPGHDCAVGTVLTQPVALALIPHTDKPITFRIATAAVDCTGYRVAESHLPIS
jgi:hypothetical protein